VRLPRDVDGEGLALRLSRLGYEETHRTGSHIRLTTHRDGTHHITIPAHDPLHVGTLSAIVRDLGVHHRMDREEVLRILF